MPYLFLFLSVLIASTAMAQNNENYQILNADKKEISYKEMLQDLQEKKMVFFGEFHDNKIIHALQLQVYEDLNEKNAIWAIGMEMLERHHNRYLQEFIHKSMAFQTFNQQAKQWPNFEQDYLPLIRLAQKYDMPVVATNIPGYLASKIAKEGWEHLNKHLEENPKEKKVSSKVAIKSGL